MRLQPTPLPGMFVVHPDKHADDRGFFARLWCEADFAAAGIDFRPLQISVSFNRAAGTLRGLHWQAPPHAEAKLVRATAGRVWDVAVDLRPDSSARGRWHAVELDAAAHTGVLIPAGCAHGFVTLTHDAELLYCIDAPHAPAAARGARYDDPAFGIAWPRPPAVIAPRDLAWPAFRPDAPP